MFSRSDEGARRRRPVAVARRGSEHVRMDVPARLAHKEGLYDAGFPVWTAEGLDSHRVVDRAWDTYEARLAELLEALERRDPIAATDWLSVLVPWVASMFVRDEGFASRFESRMGGVFGQRDDHEQNTNSARLLEMHYLLAPVSAATWVVSHAPEGVDYITNDLGLSAATGTDQLGRELHGWTLPISSSAALGIFITPTRWVMSAVDKTWIANIQHRDADGNEVVISNQLTAASCCRLIVGPDEATVEAFRSAMDAERPGFAGDPAINAMDGWFSIPTENKRAHQYDWRHLVSVAAKQPVPGACFELDVIDVDAIVDSGWTAPLFFVINRDDGWSGLDVVDGPPLSIQLDLLVGHAEDRKRQWYEKVTQPIEPASGVAGDRTFQPRGFIIPPTTMPTRLGLPGAKA